MRLPRTRLPASLLGLTLTLALSCGDKLPEDEDTGDRTAQVGLEGKDGKAKKPPEPTALPPGINLPEDQEGLVKALADGETAEPAMVKLVAMGPEVVPTLRDVAMHGTDMGARGWAIQGLSRIEDPAATKALQAIESFGQAPELVRTWAAAGLVAQATDLDAVLALAPMAGKYPALNRPIGQKVEAFQGELGDVGAALVAMGNDSNLQQVLAPAVMAKGAEPLLEVMFTHADNNARRLAAGFLGTLAQQDESQIPVIAGAYAYEGKPDKVMWDGGALYVPQLAWDRKEAREIVRELIAWHLFCDRKGLSQEKQQIYNNLRSVGLHRPAKLDWPQDDTLWLLGEWSKKHGADDAAKLLEEQGVSGVQKYVDAVAGVR